MMSDQKYNVLFVGHERSCNGASRSMINLIDSLSDRCRFFVILPYADGPVVEALKKRDVQCYYVPFYRWFAEKNQKFWPKKIVWKFLWNFKNSYYARKYKAIITENKIDIIHSNTIVVDYGYRLSKKFGIPHVWHAREMGKEDFNLFPLVSTRKFKRVVSNHNHLICISKAVEGKYKRFVDHDNLVMIYNGVGIEHYNPQKQYHENGKFKCLQAASIQPAKGQVVSVKAINELRRRGYNDIELFLAGRGSLKSLGIDETQVLGTTVLGQVENLPEIRKDMDIEIVASKAEAFGRVTVEAMLSGNPVVGSNSGGTVELINDGETGLLFQEGDAEDLAKKIEMLYLNREKIKQMGIKAREHALEHFLITRCADEVFNLYKEILRQV